MIFSQFIYKTFKYAFSRNSATGTMIDTQEQKFLSKHKGVDSYE